MKKVILFSAFAIVSLVGFSGCNDCKTCHTELMGIKGPEQEVCGDELKTVEKTPGMVCK